AGLARGPIRCRRFAGSRLGAVVLLLQGFHHRGSKRVAARPRWLGCGRGETTLTCSSLGGSRSNDLVERDDERPLLTVPPVELLALSVVAVPFCFEDPSSRQVELDWVREIEMLPSIGARDEHDVCTGRAHVERRSADDRSKLDVHNALVVADSEFDDPLV